MPKVIKNRWKIIKKYCKNKNVLDIGCIQHKADSEKNNYWLHKKIKKIASKVTGVDIQEEESKKLIQRGYNIIISDALKIDLRDQFNTIIAGEFIEHVSNPGIFLDNMHKHLKDEGVLILTTPNLFAIRYFLLNIFKKNLIPNKEHVIWFDYHTLKELCTRHNFKLKESYYHFDENTPWYKYYPVKLLTIIKKNFAPRIMFVLVKNN